MIKKLEIKIGNSVETFGCGAVSPNLSSKEKILDYLKSDNPLIAEERNPRSSYKYQITCIPRNSILYIRLIGEETPYCSHIL